MMAVLYRFAAVVLLALTLAMVWSPPAHAAFSATFNSAACTTAPCYEWLFPSSSTSAASGWFPTGAQACAYGVGKNYYSVVIVTSTFSSPVTCVLTPNGNTTISQRTRTPDASAYSCPASSTLSGSTCTCTGTAVQVLNNGVYSCSTAAVDLAKQVADALNFIGAPLIQNGGPTLIACYAGYQMRGTGSASNGGTYNEIYGPFTATGQTCSSVPAVPNPAPLGCKPTEYTGTVNGLPVCVPAVETASDGERVTAPNPAGGASAPVSAVSPDAPPGATGSTEETICKSGSCVTKKQFTDSTGAVVGTKTETQTKDAFCVENPAASVCVQGKFSGSCSSFVCEGDAVQCALTKEVHLQNCKLNAVTSESAAYDAAKTKTGDVTANLPGNSTVNFGSASFDTSDSIGGKQCIGNVSDTIYGFTITLPFGTYICPHAQNLRLVLLALSFLAGFYIIARRS